MIEILLMILSVILLVIVTFCCQEVSEQILITIPFWKTNETALEEDASNNVSSAFLMTRVTFLLILFIYAGIIYLTGVYNYNYTIFTLSCFALLVYPI